MAPAPEQTKLLEADPAGVESVERLALDLGTSLAAWGSTTPPAPLGVIWCIGVPKLAEARLILSAIGFLPSCVLAHAASVKDKALGIERAKVVKERLRSARTPALKRAGDVAGDAWLWDKAAELGLRVPEAMPRGAQLRNRKYGPQSPLAVGSQRELSMCST